MESVRQKTILYLRSTLEFMYFAIDFLNFIIQPLINKYGFVLEEFDKGEFFFTNKRTFNDRLTELEANLEYIFIIESQIDSKELKETIINESKTRWSNFYSQFENIDVEDFMDNFQDFFNEAKDSYKQFVEFQTLHREEIEKDEKLKTWIEMLS